MRTHDEDAVVAKFKAGVPDIKHVNTASAMLLGALIGGEQSVGEVLSSKLQQLRCLSDRLSLLNVHDALFYSRTVSLYQS